MRRILTLAWLNLLQVLKDRVSLGLFIVLPVMLTFLFGTALGGGERKISIAVNDQDATSYSSEVAAALPEASYALRVVDEETARKMASSGEVAASIIIPKGFGADLLEGIDTTVTVVKDPRSTAAIAVVQTVDGRVKRLAADAAVIRIVRAAFRDAGRMTASPLATPSPADIYAYADRLWKPSPPLSVHEEAVTASKVRGAATQAMGFQQYSLGYTLMFMMFMGLGAAGGFLEEREQGTLARLLVTPTSKPVLVAGKVVGIYATVMLQAAILVGAGALLFGVPWGQDPLAVVLLIGTFGLATTGMGVMVSTIVRTRGQMSAVTAVLAVVLSMLGGAYWPLDIVSPAMRAVAYATPTGWAMIGLTDVVVRYQGVAQAILPSLVLTGMAAVFLAVGISRLKLE
jgi:ABC-2 type transport system permease protein